MGGAVRRARVFISGMFRGLESPADLYVVNSYSYPHKSELQAMRGDWVRVGDQMQSAVTKLNGETIARTPR